MCDTVVVVRRDGVVFGKNSDRDANEAQVLEWHAPRHADAGATVQCTWIEIPDVPHSYAVLLSRPFWMWGAEMGTNEHGVTIGNEAVFTREHYAETGLTGMDLLRLALERADSAERAVAVLVELLEAHGQGGGCGHEDRSFTYHNSFLVADPFEAWVLETAGRRWAEERITAGVRSISNGLTIPGFARRHADRLRTRVAAARTRRTITSALPATATPGDVMTVLRSHGRSVAPEYSIVNGGLSAPCVHAGGLVTASQTTASWVADLRPDAPLHWVTATAAPCTSVFKPVWVDEPLALGPLPDDHDDGGTSLWWRHERLHRTAMRDPLAAYGAFAVERNTLEARWLLDPPPSKDAFAEADAALHRWTEAVDAVVHRDMRPWYVRRYWRERDRRARLIPASSTAAATP